MGLVWYHSPMSTSNITEAVLAELGTPHEQIILNIKVTPVAASIRGTGRCPAFRRKSHTAAARSQACLDAPEARRSAPTTWGCRVLCCARDPRQ